MRNYNTQALKANPDACPLDFKMGNNMIQQVGRVALDEALDMVVELSGKRPTFTY